MPRGLENAVLAEVIQMEFNGVTQDVAETGIQGEGVCGIFPPPIRIYELRMPPNCCVMSRIHKTVLDHTVQIGVHIIAKNPMIVHGKSKRYRVGALRTCMNGTGIKRITSRGCIGDGGRKRYGVVARIGNEDRVVSGSQFIEGVVVAVIGEICIRAGLNSLIIGDIPDGVVLLVEDHHMKGEMAIGESQLHTTAVDA